MIKREIRLATILAVAATLAGCSADRMVAPASAPTQEWIRQQHEIIARLEANPPRPMDPLLIYIDGKELRGETADSGFAVINPERLATIRIYEGAEAEAMAGQPAPHGLLWITTKQANASR